MQLDPKRITGISAFIAYTFVGTTVAFAQAPQNPVSEAPTFQKEIKSAPVPVQKDAVPQLKPVTPVLVISGDAPVAGDAKVVPPPPRMIARVAGRVAVPGSLGASSGRLGLADPAARGFHPLAGAGIHHVAKPGSARV